MKNIFKSVFSAEPAFGLDISDLSVELAYLKREGEQISLVSFNKVDLEDGVVEDGKILDKVKMAEAIKRAVSNIQGPPLDTNKVICAIPDSRVFIYNFELPPNLSPDQIKNVIQYEVQGVIPVSADNLYYDFQIINIENNGEKTDVFYAATLKEIVDDYREVLKECALEPLVFDTESEGLAMALIKDIGTVEPTVLLDIGGRTSVISIFDRDGIRSTVNSPIAGNEITERLSLKMNISQPEAENMKRSYGLDPEKENGRVMLIIQSALQEIIKEAWESINYYEKKNNASIKKMILTGGTSQLPRLLNYFQDNFVDIKVEMGKPWFINGKANKLPFISITALGLALRGVSRDPKDGINLIGEGEEAIAKKAKKRTERPPLPEAPPAKGKVSDTKAPAPKLRGDREVISRRALGRLKLPFSFPKLRLPKFSMPKLDFSNGGNFFSGLAGYIKKNKKKLLFVVLPIILAIILGGFLIGYLRSGKIGSQKAELAGQKSVKDMVSSFDVVLDTTKKDPSKLPADLLETIVEKRIKVPVEAEPQVVTGLATGIATIYNNRSYEQTLVATTRLLSPNGLLYHTKEEIDIPAGGKKNVAIYADKEGKGQELGPTRFTIPGLSSSLQSLVYAETNVPTIGGEERIWLITQNTLDKAKEAFVAEFKENILSGLSKDVIAAWKDSALRGESVLENVMESEIIEITTKEQPGEKIEEDPSKAQGEDAGKVQIEVRAKIKMKGVKFDVLRLEQLAKLDLADKVEGDIETDYYIDLSYNFNNFENNLVYMTVTAEAVPI